MHGQEIADELAKRKGEKPSPGTIYPALKGLREAGFLEEEKEGKTITYTLTPNLFVKPGTSFRCVLSIYSI